MEFGVIPLISWLHGSNSYLFPTHERIYAWSKFVAFATVICGSGAWLYDKRRFGR
jgi:hypothetical protein